MNQITSEPGPNMNFSALTFESLPHHYANATEALYQIGATYCVLGKINEAKNTLHTALNLVDTQEMQQQSRLKLLLLYGNVLIIDYILSHTPSDALFPMITRAQQLAEATHDQQALTDAMSLLGQALYFRTVYTNLDTVIAGLNNGKLPDHFKAKFEEALSYHLQALEGRDRLHDTRGISESHFFIGNIYERWQQYEEARDHYLQASKVANDYNHPFEKPDPIRHLAALALIGGRTDDALTLAMQALSLRKEAGFMPLLPLDYLLIRDIYLAKGDSENAQIYNQAAASLADEIGMREALATQLNRHTFN